MDKIITAAAYVRVSTDDQLEYSPDSQIKKIYEYAERNNIHIPDEYIFIDEGISGRKAEKRPGFMKMIAIAKSRPKPFEKILVWKFSRFARNREDSIVYKSALKKQCGIDVISVSEQIGEDKTSILIEAMLEAMDEYYSINLAEEVKRGMNEKFSRGGVVSQPPFGYKMGEGIFIPDDEAAPVVKMIFEEYVSGTGIRQIAAKLNDFGIRSVKGNRFESRTVEYILRNPVYIGKLRRNPHGRIKGDRFHQSPDTVIVNGKHQPIISQELFELANQKLDESKKGNNHIPLQNASGYMLYGLVHCSSCGSVLVQAIKGKSLQCYRYSKGQCSISHSVTLSAINSAVIQKLISDLNINELTIEIKDRSINETKNANDMLIRREYKKLERIKAAFESGIDGLDEYKLNKSVIMNRIERLRREETQDDKIKSLTGKVNISFEELLSLSDENLISENARNVLLRSIISQIVFDRGNSTVQIKYQS